MDSQFSSQFSSSSVPSSVPRLWILVDLGNFGLILMDFGLSLESLWDYLWMTLGSPWAPFSAILIDFL